MAKEVFDCSNCGGHGTISFKQDDSRFSLEVLHCPFCGTDLENEFAEVEDEYDE